MHSIAILGDVRLHRLDQGDTDNQGIIYGGAMMMTDAIRDVLLNAAPLLPPKIHNVHEIASCRGIELKEGQKLNEWSFDYLPLEGVPNLNHRFVLSSKKEIGAVSLPAPAPPFIFDLMTGGFRDLGRSPIFDRAEKLIRKYEKPGAGKLGIRDWKADIRSSNELKDGSPLLEYAKKHFKSVPDIVVVDDLGSGIGSIKFQIEESNAKWSAAKYRDQVVKLWAQNVCNKKAFEDFKAAIVAKKEEEERFRELHEVRRELTRQTLSMLFARLRRANDSVSNIGTKAPLEPILILSAADTLPSLLDESSGGSGMPSDLPERTLWQHAYDDKAQRRRTVVILDAETLRTRVSVSSGLSWERTAQDTLLEMQRHPEMRRYLEFGCVVVRFGLTGALLLVNEGGHHRYTLYFNPDHDDVHWSQKDDDVVLGETSILVASIVEALNEKCRWRSGRVGLADISASLDQALPLAVQRFARHKACGYGTNPSELSRTREHYAPFVNEVFQSSTDQIEVSSGAESEGCKKNLIAARACIQRVDLAPFRSRHWSILSQSVQSELNTVAKQIVMHGPKVVLNTTEQPLRPFVEVWLKAILKEFRAKSALKSLRPSLLLPYRKRATEYRSSGNLLVQAIKSQLTVMSQDQEHVLQRQYGIAMIRAAKKLQGEFSSKGVELELTHLLDELRHRHQNFCQASMKGIRSELHELMRLRRERRVGANTAKNRKQPVERLGELVKEELHYNLSFYNQMRDKHDEVGDRKALHLLVGPVDRTGHLSGYQDEMEVRGAFGRLRTAVLWYLSYNESQMHFAQHERIQAIRSRFEEIDTELYIDPARLLHRHLVSLLQKRQPETSTPNSISTPVLRVGQSTGGVKDNRLTVVDRKEVESIRQVKRLVEGYLKGGGDKKLQRRPLSFAVFGPPGSGKSVAVKQIIRQLKSGGSNIQKYTINLAELKDADALRVALENVEKVSGDHTPFVFFDEFDSRLGREKNGWLKYFLPVMEDGKFREVEIEQAVYVFAGGTCDTFEEFSLADSSRTDQQRLEFSVAKGPDFVSRLHGHINVVGVNPTGPDDDLYLIRRALSLRFLLTESQELNDLKEAEIDDQMLNAFLHVPRYIHGTRSMRTLVDLCVKGGAGTVSMSAVPPIHQLDMQVDGKAFASLAMGQIKPR